MELPCFPRCLPRARVFPPPSYAPLPRRQGVILPRRILIATGLLARRCRVISFLLLVWSGVSRDTREIISRFLAGP